MTARSTFAGVFGMARTTLTPSGTRFWMNEVVMPAAIEMTRLPVSTNSPTSSSRAPMSCGLTTRTTTLAPRTASGPSAKSIEYRLASSSRRSGRFSTTVIVGVGVT